MTLNIRYSHSISPIWIKYIDKREEEIERSCMSLLYVDNMPLKYISVHEIASNGMTQWWLWSQTRFLLVLNIYHFHNIPLWRSWYSAGYFMPVYFHLLCSFYAFYIRCCLIVGHQTMITNVQNEDTPRPIYLCIRISLVRFFCFHIYYYLKSLVNRGECVCLVSAFASSRHGIKNRKVRLNNDMMYP